MSFFQRARNKIESLVNNSAIKPQPTGGRNSVLGAEFCESAETETKTSVSSKRGTSPTQTTVSDDATSSQHNTPSRAGPTAQENAIVEELTADAVDLDKLKKLCWSGVPDSFRAECWGVLTGYYPLNYANREVFMKRKRAEYHSYVSSSYSNVDWDRLLDQGNNGSITSLTGGGELGGGGPGSKQQSAAELSDGGPQSPGSVGGGALVGAEELGIMKQIRKDLPRAGNVKVLHVPRIQKIMERILYIWAIRHPACGYVQGMNDLVYPFLYVLLVDHVAAANGRVSYFVAQKSVEESEESLKVVGAAPAVLGNGGGQTTNSGSLEDVSNAGGSSPNNGGDSKDNLVGIANNSSLGSATQQQPQPQPQQQGLSPTIDGWYSFEADLYWNVSRVMEKVQANYTFNQAGAHAMVTKLEELTKVVDPLLYKHLEKMGVAFFNFSFRWMNCLLLREINPMQALRLWDTYLCEEDYSSFHVYVCCELLVRWSPYIRRQDDPSNVLTFLQNPPTSNFHDRDLDEIVSAAYVLQQTYDKSFKHLLETRSDSQQ